MPTLAMVYDLIARDRASAVFTRVGMSTEAAGVRAERSSKQMKHFAEAVGAFVALEIGKKMVQTAGDFQQGTNVLVTAAGETQKNLAGIRQGILAIAQGTGTPLKELTDGMYSVEKAGFRGADGLKILKAAAQGAREEGASLATVTGAMTSVMASYHLPASRSVMVMNEMKTAAGESKTTMEAFAASLGTVLPIASANGISFAKVAGSLASLTQHGVSADEAAQELANTMRNLAAPNQVAIKMMGQFGISSQDVSQKLGKRGVAGTLEYLSETVLRRMGPSGKVLLDTFMRSQSAGKDLTVMLGQMAPSTRKVAEEFVQGHLDARGWQSAIKGMTGDQAVLARQFTTVYNTAHGFNAAIRAGQPGAVTYTAAIKAMTGGANGLNTTLQLTGESTKGTDERIRRIAASARGAGKDVDGWASTQKLFNVQMDILKERVQVIGVRIGNSLMPKLIVAAKEFGHMADFVQRNNKWLVPLAGTLLSVASAIVVVTKVTQLWKAAQIALDVAMVANPIGILIAAIAGLVAGVIYAYGHVKWFRDLVNKMGETWKNVAVYSIKYAKDFGHWVGDAFQSVAAWAKGMWHDVATNVVGMWHDVTKFFMNMWHDITKVSDGIAAFIKRHWRLILTIVTGGVGFIVVLVVNHWKQISKLFGDGYRVVSNWVKKLWKDVSGFFVNLWHDVTRFTSLIWDTESKGWGRIWSTVSGFAKRVWHDVSGFFTSLWHDISKIVGAIWDTEKTGWNRIWSTVTGWAKKLWQDTKRFFGNLKDDIANILGRSGLLKIFNDGVAAIGRAWKGLQDLAKRPISFIINTVLNGGLIKAFNWVMGELHEKKVAPIKIPGFARGGVLPGYTPVHQGDDVLTPMRSGEGVYVSEAMRDPYERKRLVAVNRAALSGRDLGAYQQEGYATGGFVNPDARVRIGGQYISRIAEAQLQLAEKLFGQIYHVMQGGYGGRHIAASGTSHNYPGVADISPGSITTERNLRKVGFAAWARNVPGRSRVGSGAHVHAVSLIDPGDRNSPQVTGSWPNHGNGLSGYHNDPAPHYPWVSNLLQRLGATNLPALGGGGGGGASFVDYVGQLNAKFVGVLIKLTKLNASPFGQMVAKAPRMIAAAMVNKVKSLAAVVGGIGSAIGGAVASGSNRVRGMALMTAAGWGPAQWPALNKLWTRESNWRTNARNPSSGAYGIPQSLPASKMRSAGADYLTNPNTQIRWGLGYIRDRYGSPTAAWVHELAHGWYDQGGVATGRGLMPKNTIKPERVLSAQQTIAFDRLVAAMERNGTSRGPLIQIGTVSTTVDLDLIARHAEFRERRGSFT